MSLQETTGIAFVLSLIGGTLMLISGVFSSVWFMSGGTNGDEMMGGFGGMMGGMMGGYQNTMGGFGVPLGFMGGLSFIGFLSGIFVIVGAIMLNSRPRERVTWGTLILAFSVISFLGMGGFYIGALLGIAGGAIALSWKPAAKA